MSQKEKIHNIGNISSLLMLKQKMMRSFDGTELYYLINRVNTKPFLIFIHGAGSNHTVYKPFFAAFEETSFIAVDIRNHGKSGRCPLESVSLHNIAKDITAILAQEGIHDVILIGNSLGASVAVEFYKMDKKRTKKLILFTLFSKRYIKGAWLWNAVARITYVVVKPFYRNQKKKFLDYHKYAQRPIWYYPYLDIRGTSIATILKCIKDLFETPLYVYNINVPAQIFVCQDDWSTKNTLIKSDCKENKLIKVVDIKSNHIVLTRQWEEVIKQAKQFIADKK